MILCRYSHIITLTLCPAQFKHVAGADHPAQGLYAGINWARPVQASGRRRARGALLSRGAEESVAVRVSIIGDKNAF